MKTFTDRHSVVFFNPSLLEFDVVEGSKKYVRSSKIITLVNYGTIGEASINFIPTSYDG